jgi:hypothetical protein
MAETFGKSLAFQHFQKSIEAEIRNYWQINTSLIYASRWWNNIPSTEWPARISLYPGDTKNPFNSIDLPPQTYLDNQAHVISLTRENAILNFITAFEVYLYNIVKRIIFLDPSVINDSEMPFEAKDIALALNTTNFRDWFAEKVTQQYIKNKTHLKSIIRIQKLVKYEIVNPNKTLVENWNKWTYVRNAIVHNGREVSEDLKNVWSDRYTHIGSSLNLEDGDIIKVQYTAMELAKIIDELVMNKFIQYSDAELLTRELFIRDGIDDSKILAVKIFKILGCKFGKPLAEKSIAFQKRTSSRILGWRFTHYNFIE